jgi:hypothetical protein
MGHFILRITPHCRNLWGLRGLFCLHYTANRKERKNREEVMIVPSPIPKGDSYEFFGNYSETI